MAHRFMTQVTPVMIGRMTHTKLLSGLLMGLAFGAAHAGEAPAALRPDQAAFREIYRELVETNTTLSAAAARSPPSAWPRT